MKTIEIFKYDELSDEAKVTARENVELLLRDAEYYQAEDWAIDDCALFEPAHEEMVKLFGKEYTDMQDFVFKNNRKNIYLYDDAIHITDALEIADKKKFEIWLGIQDAPELSYEIVGDRETYIDLYLTEPDDSFDSHEGYAEIVDNARKKFEAHMKTIMQRIEDSIEFYFTDEDNIENRIEGYEMEFYIDGRIYKNRSF